MSEIYYILLPLVGALIGWLTNWIAVKLIFRPYQPVKLLGYTLQGVVPKRREELAKRIGEVIEKELLSADDLLKYLGSKEMVGGIGETLSSAIKTRIMEKLPLFIPLSLKGIISDAITEQVQKELPSFISDLLSGMEGKFKEKFKPGEIVEIKVNSFPLDRLEAIILAVAARELKHIEVLGGVLGFVIGLLQVMLLMLMT